MKTHSLSSILATVTGLILSMSAPGAPILLSGPINNPANGHNYYLLSSDLWGNSEVVAQALGGNLVTLNDSAENTWVFNTFANYGGVTRDLWLGLSFNGSSYVWADGEAFSYSNWEPGQPDNPGFENYIHMFAGSNPAHLPGWVPAAWNDISNISGYILNNSGGVERDIFGVVEVVPEPSAFALLTLAGACVLKRKQSRAKV